MSILEKEESMLEKEEKTYIGAVTIKERKYNICNYRIDKDTESIRLTIDTHVDCDIGDIAIINFNKEILNNSCHYNNLIEKLLDKSLNHYNDITTLFENTELPIENIVARRYNIQDININIFNMPPYKLTYTQLVMPLNKKGE